MTDQDVENLLNINEYTRRETDIEKYLTTIIGLYQEGYKPGIIYAYILKNGFQGSTARLRRIIQSIGSNNFNVPVLPDAFVKRVLDPNVRIIKRADILKWITITDKKKMADTAAAKAFDQIKQRYPVVEEAENVWNQFHEILMGDKKEPEDLIKFLMDNACGPVQSFVNGIKKDIEPVVAAISTGVNSGFVEGMNNSYKLTKRTMFGRSGLDMLFRKNYAISSLYHLKKSPKEILNSKKKNLKEESSN